MNNALTKWKPLFLTLYKYILFQIVEVEWTDSELFKGQLLSSYRICCSCNFEATMSVYSVREKCESEGALLERAWQTRQSKVKPWTIFLLHAWKSITQTPLVNAREKDPTQRQTSPFPLSPSLLNLPPLHDSVCPYPLFFKFSFFCFAVDVFLFSFIALFNKLGCRTPVIGYSEIAVKWFISWLTFTTCMNFCECTCICKRAEPGAGRGRRRANFLFLISELALNQGSKVGLAQQLWQDKHLFSLLLEARVILLPAICKPLKRPVHTCVNTDVNMGKHQFFSLRGKH